jgi:putative FmdB family regulatory protein
LCQASFIAGTNRFLQVHNLPIKELTSKVMPTYEYQCIACGHHFEKFQSFSAEPLKSCPVCGEPIKKVISPAGIIFKGSGWYITDSKKANAATPATVSAEKKNGHDKAASGSEGTEAKPAESSSTEPKPAASKPAEVKSSEAAA